MCNEKNKDKISLHPINPVNNKRIELHGFSTHKRCQILFPQQSRILFFKAQLDQNIISSLS
jgi:hypothetical protein